LKRLFLHIGFYKTGSTSVQRNMVQNAEALRKQGICYPYDPQAPYTQRWQHAPLAAALPGRKLRWLTPGNAKTLNCAYQSMFAAFEASGCDTLVLSSEGFCDPDVNAMRLSWLQEKFADFDITVIAYIRRQDAYFLSTYQEMIKAGSTKAFDFSAYPGVARLYFARRLAPWRAAFGAERVIVRPFSPTLWPEGELFFDFLHVIGATRADMTLQPPENEGLDYRAVEFMRQLNLLGAEAQGSAPARPRPPVQKLTAAFSRTLEAEGSLQKMMLSSEQAELLRRHFLQDNIKALAGSEINIDDFFPPPPSGHAARLVPPEFDPHNLLRLIAQLSPRPQRP